MKARLKNLDEENTRQDLYAMRIEKNEEYVLKLPKGVKINGKNYNEFYKKAQRKKNTNLQKSFISEQILPEKYEFSDDQNLSDKEVIFDSNRTPIDILQTPMKLPDFGGLTAKRRKQQHSQRRRRRKVMRNGKEVSETITSDFDESEHSKSVYQSSEKHIDTGTDRFRDSPRKRDEYSIKQSTIRRKDIIDSGKKGKNARDPYS